MISVRFFDSPDILTGDCTCIRIQQNLVFVKQQPGTRIARAVDPIGVLKLLDVQIENNHGVYIADLIRLRKRKRGVRCFFAAVEQEQLTGCSAMCVDCKVDTTRNRQRAI